MNCLVGKYVRLALFFSLFIELLVDHFEWFPLEI
jgi:hypothetical protein